MLCCGHFEIHNFWTKGPKFLLCTGPTTYVASPICSKYLMRIYYYYRIWHSITGKKQKKYHSHGTYMDEADHDNKHNNKPINWYVRSLLVLCKKN